MRLKFEFSPCDFYKIAIKVLARLLIVHCIGNPTIFFLSRSKIFFKPVFLPIYSTILAKTSHSQQNKTQTHPQLCSCSQPTCERGYRSFKTSHRLIEHQLLSYNEMQVLNGANCTSLQASDPPGATTSVRSYFMSITFVSSPTFVNAFFITKCNLFVSYSNTCDLSRLRVTYSCYYQTPTCTPFLYINHN